MRTMLVSLLSLTCLASMASPVQAHPLLSSARSTSLPPAAATSKCHYFVGFTEDGQASRGDVFNDQSVKVTGLAGSSFLTSSSLFKLIGGVLLIETSEKPLTVVVRQKSYATRPRSLYVFDMHGPVIRWDESSTTLTERERRAQHLWRLASGYSCASQPCRITAAHGSVFSVGERCIVVAQGSLLIDAPAKTVIGTPVGYMTCEKRFVASLRTVNDAMCVENLTVPRPILLAVKGASLPLAAGRCAIVRKGLPCADIIPGDGLPRRGFVAHTNGGITVLTADFMASSLFRSQKHMSESIVHPITAYQSNLAQELLKGAAAVQVATAGRGGFSWRPASLPIYRLGAVMDPLAGMNSTNPFKLRPGSLLLSR